MEPIKCIFCLAIIDDNQKPVGRICKNCFNNMMFNKNGWKTIE